MISPALRPSSGMSMKNFIIKDIIKSMGPVVRELGF
jgi:hypothetical protein